MQEYVLVRLSSLCPGNALEIKSLPFHGRRFSMQTEMSDSVTVRSRSPDLHVVNPIRVGVHNIVREVDEQLCEASLGSRIVSEHRRKGSVAQRLGKTLPQSLTGTCVVAQAAHKLLARTTFAVRVGYLPKEAPNNMLKQSGGLRLDELGNHIAQDCANGIEALIRGTDVIETVVIQQDFLNDENGHGLAKLRTRLHDPQA